MEAGKDFAPAAVAAATVALNEKMLSPAVTSPFVPSSKNACVDDPPIELRSTVTPSPVLAGFAPGATFTVKSVEFPACTVVGLAAPVPAGFVGVFPGIARIEMLSIA